MKSSHSGETRARSQRRYSRGRTRSARGKTSHGSQFPRSTCQSAAEVIFRIAVAAWKTGTAGTNDAGDLGSGDAMAEQLLGDPLIDNAPIGLWETSTNSQPVEPIGVDRSGSRWAGARIRITSNQQRRREWRRWSSDCSFRLLPQSGACRCHAGPSIHDLYPGSVSASVAPLRLLVGEASQAAEVPPIAAGQVATVALSQLLADETGRGWRQRCAADVHPRLEIAGAGLQDHTRCMAISLHDGKDLRAGVIQVYQNIAGILLIRVRLKIHVTALAVAYAQETYSSGMEQFRGSPQPLTGESSSGWMMNQSNQVEITGHARELAAHGLQRQMESTIEHGPNFGIGERSRTMTSQRTANSGLTGCLSQGVHRSLNWRASTGRSY